MASKVNLDDLPYDEYQKEMARIEAEAAEQAKNAELGNQPMPENDEHSSFDDFVGKQKSAALGEDESEGGENSPSDDVVGDQADDPTTGDKEVVTEESNPEAFRAGQELEEKMSALKDGAERSVSGAFQNFLGGLKGLFAGASGKAIQTVMNIGQRLGIPKAATFGLLFILGGGTFAGITGLFSNNNDLYKYGNVSDGCEIVSLKYRDNAVYKAPTQDQLDGKAGALFNALNSDMHFKYAIRNGGTGVLSGIQDDVFDDGYEYDYVQNPTDRYDWNGDGVIDDEDDRSRHIKGGYHDYDNIVEKFQDEQILGMIMNASAESNIDPSTYEMNYRVGPTEDSNGTSNYYINLNDKVRDLVLSRTHHTMWNSYCERMFALYAADGTSINTSAYQYTDQFGNTTDSTGKQNYYPGVGLWQWTGQRGYNLHWFSNQLKDNTDADGDGANDAMYSLNVQIAYLVEIEAKPVRVNGIDVPIKDWGHEVVSSYQVEYYVNVPYKNSIGTDPGGIANWIPMNDYQDPTDRSMRVAWDAYDQLRSQAKYKYESPSGARLSDKNYDDARDAVYLSDSDRYNGNITAFDDAPFPVKDYVYNRNGSIYKEEKHKYGSGEVEDGTEQSDQDENGDGVIDSNDTRTAYKTVYGYDINDDGVIDEDDLLIEDGKLAGHEGFDVDGDGTIDVWDMNDNGEIDDDGSDWYVDHDGYNDDEYKDGIFIPKEVYYQNISVMVLASADGDYNSGEYIYENDSHALRQYNDTTTTIDYTHEKAKIVYQSPGITAIDVWDEKPWGNGTYTVANFSEAGGVSVDYKAIQEGDTWWDQLEAARKDHTNYGKETDDPRDAFRSTADTWRDEIWIWANAHARAAVARNKGLEFAIGWVGCPGGMLESHTMFVTGGSSFAGRLDTTAYNKKADCLEHYAECMLKIDWHGSDKQGKSITDLLYEDMDTTSVRDVWYADDSYCGGDFDNSSIAACAVSWAWLKGHNSDADVNLSVLDPSGCPKAYLCTSLYCAVHDIVYPNDPYYSSCDRGAGTAVRASGSDDEYPAGNPYQQFDHMRSRPTEWQDCGPLASAWSSMEPGDIIVSTGTSSRHIIVFVGPDAVYEKWGNSVGDATHAIVHSSHSSDLSSSRGPRCDLDGSYLLSDSSHGYRVFRCMNQDTNSSTLKSAVDAQSSSLGGLNNGDGNGGGYYAPQY